MCHSLISFDDDSLWSKSKYVKQQIINLAHHQSNNGRILKKKASCIKLRYPRFEHSDWLKKIELPIRRLEEYVGYIYALSFVYCIW